MFDKVMDFLVACAVLAAVVSMITFFALLSAEALLYIFRCANG